MAVGWAGDNAVNEQIDATVKDAVKRARENAYKGESLEYCEICDEPISEARRKALPGVRLCVRCRQESEAQEGAAYSSYNRRASKDSQLR